MKTLIHSFVWVSLILSVHASAGTLAADLKSIGVNPIIEKKFSPRLENSEAPEDRYFLQVKLGWLSPEQFKSLMKRYGNYSKVAYNPNRYYELIDFLPPVMQGLVNKTFQSSYIPVSSRNNEISFIFKNGVTIASNCFNTTFEMIRTLQNKDLEFKHRFFIPDRWKSTEVMQNESYGQYVSPSQVRPYDVLYYIAVENQFMSNIQHTAIYLSDDLVFEKTDSMENDPYRISFTEDVKSKYKRLLPQTFKSYKLLNRRFLLAGKKPLPDLKVALEEVPFSEPGMIQKLPAALKKMNLSMGCETGLGGGCDMNFYNVQEGLFRIDPMTGRGQAFGPVINRIRSL